MAKIIREKMVRKEDRVELLLRVTLEYKALKLHEKGDRESWKSKFADISDIKFSAYPEKKTYKRKRRGLQITFSLGTITQRL